MEKIFEIRNESAGIGDALLGMTIVTGMRRQHPDVHLMYSVHPHAAPFVELFTGYDSLWLTTGKHEMRPDQVFELYSNTSYQRELAERGKGSRAEHYAAVCHVEPCLPTHHPLPGSTVAGCIALVPFSSGQDRDWLLPNWLALEDMLMIAGEQVVILHDEMDPLKNFKGKKIVNANALEVAGVVKEAKMVIGGDTGIMHLAGCLQTKGIALCAQVRGSQVYGMYPYMEVIDGKLPCSGCYWQATPPICKFVCASLNQITTQEVFRTYAKLCSSVPAGT
jgi:ADP-heptose:LPS heptosyltransferase